jgi:hypothetical protein
MVLDSFDSRDEQGIPRPWRKASRATRPGPANPLATAGLSGLPAGQGGSLLRPRR